MKAASKSPTPQIGTADVLCFTPIDERHRFTAACTQIVNGRVASPVQNLAIAQYAGDKGYYLFGCDTDWRCITDTYHDSIDEAKRQAEFEYAGTMATWLELKSK